MRRTVISRNTTILLFALLLTACGGTNITGKWVIDEITVDERKGPAPAQLKQVLELLSGTTYDIHEDGSFQITGAEEATGTWQKKGGKYHFSKDNGTTEVWRISKQEDKRLEVILEGQPPANTDFTMWIYRP